MPTLKGTALMPHGDRDGFTPIADELAKDPLRVRAAIVIFNCKRGTTDFAADETALTIELLRAELLLAQDLGDAERLLRRALEFRSGQTTLDLELEDEIKRAFDAMREPDSPVDPDEGQADDGKGKGSAGPKS
jgi:hypothetical protein